VANETRFQVVNLKLGRVALKTAHGYVSINPADGQISLNEGKPGATETFQWMETLYGDTILLALATANFQPTRLDRNRIARTVPALFGGPNDLNYET
jgi:hypothetical protein